MVLAVIQARMGSTRLPGKVMLNILDKPVIWHVVSRVRSCSRIDKVVVATGNNEANKEIVDFCNRNSVDCFAGNESDVLDRFYQVACFYGLREDDVLVRVTCDCPLIDPEIIGKVIELYYNSGVNYASNVNPPTYPDGLDVEVFGFASLERAWRDAKLPSEREHVTPYMRGNSEIFKRANLLNEVDLSALRWTLDEKEDFEAIEEIYHGLSPKGSTFCFAEIIEFIRGNPDIIERNSKFHRNEGYLKSLDQDRVRKQDKGDR